MYHEWIISADTAVEESSSSAWSLVLSILVFIGLIKMIGWVARLAHERSDIQSRLTNRSVGWWIGLGLCIGAALSAIVAVLTLAIAGMPTEDDELSLAEFLFISVVPVMIVMSAAFGLVGWTINRRQRQG